MATCILTGTVENPPGTPLMGALVRVRTVGPVLLNSGAGVATNDLTTVTAVDGTWSLTLAQGLSAQIDIPAIGMANDITIPALTVADLSTLTLYARGTLTPATILSDHGPSMGGDLTGSSPSPTVVGLRGKPLHADTPADGKVWVYRNANADYRLESFPVTAAVTVVNAGQGITVTGTTTPTVAVTSQGITNGMMATGAAAANVGALGGDLTGTLPNAEIAAGAVTNAEVNNAANIAWTKISKIGALAADVGAVGAGTVIAEINASVETPKIAAAQLAGGIAESQVTGLVADLAAKRNTADDIPQSEVTNLVSNLAAKQATSEKGAVGGYAGLDGTGKVPLAQLPPAVLADGDRGDVTVSSGGTVFTIDPAAVSYAKIQNVSSTDRVLGRASSGAGTIEEITVTSAGRALLDDAAAIDQRTTLGLGTSAVKNIPAIGDAAATEVVFGTDTRLADARTPTAHTHAESDVTSLVGDLAAKVPTSRTVSTTSPLAGGGALSGDLTLSVGDAAAGAKGVLQLTGDLGGTASSPTVALVGTSTAALVHAAELLANAAVSAKTAGAIVRRDGSGAAALDVTGNLTGNASGTAASITGVNPIANGGTGQATAALGFNALAPTSAKGDLIAHTGATNTRVPVGADGLALIADAASTAGVKWAAPASGSVTSVATGNGLQGGPITSAGTVDLKLLAGGGLSKTLGTGSELGIAAGGVSAAMLASTAVSPASYGTATQTPTVVIDQQGRVTAASNTAIQIAESQVTNLAADLAAKATASGTTGYLPKFTGAAAIGNSPVYTDGTNVGIGTAAPSTLLHLQSNSPVVKLRTIGAGTRATPLESGVSFHDYADAIAGKVMVLDSATEDLGKAFVISLAQTSDGALTERLRIDRSGNVGIGTATPATPLDVNGVGRMSVQDKGGMVFNVVAYGADPTGAVDATAIIGTIITAMGAGGGVIYFPPGNFKFSALTISNPGTILRGAGSGATTLSTTSTGGTAITLAGGGTRLEGVTVDVIGGAVTPQISVLASGANVTLSDVTLTDWFRGIYVTGVGCKSSDIILSSPAAGAEYGVKVFGTNRAAQIDGISITGAVGTGIYLDDSGEIALLSNASVVTSGNSTALYCTSTGGTIENSTFVGSGTKYAIHADDTIITIRNVTAWGGVNALRVSNQSGVRVNDSLFLSQDTAVQTATGDAVCLDTDGSVFFSNVTVGGGAPTFASVNVANGSTWFFWDGGDVLSLSGVIGNAKYGVLYAGDRIALNNVSAGNGTAFTTAAFSGGALRGGAVASGASVTLVSRVTHVTGVAAIATITAPTSSDPITIIPDGSFTFTTAGNIGVAMTAKIGVPIILAYDDVTAKWYPTGTSSAIRSVEAVTTTKSPTVDESGEVYTNEGDADGAGVTLPTAAAGLVYSFVVQAAQLLTVTASAGDTIRLGENVTAAAGYIRSNIPGDHVTLLAINATEWIATSFAGEWTNGTWWAYSTHAQGAIYWSTPAATSNVAATPIKAAGTTGAQGTPVKVTQAATNRLTYTGAATRNFSVSATVGVSAAAATNGKMYIYKDGVLIPGATISRAFSNTDTGAMAIHALVSLATNSYVELWCETDDGDDLTIQNGVLSLTSID